jgi:hypothetical protein
MSSWTNYLDFEYVYPLVLAPYWKMRRQGRWPRGRTCLRKALAMQLFGFDEFVLATQK